MSSKRAVGEFTRKKSVEHYKPNSWRIFNEEIKENSQGNNSGNAINRVTIKQGKTPSHETSLTTIQYAVDGNKLEKRHNPRSSNTKTISDNCRYLGAPINFMEEITPPSGENHWWPESHGVANEQAVAVGNFTKNTTQRAHYSVAPTDGNRQLPHGRHGSNPHVLASKGIVPTRTYANSKNERISFHHNFNSRANRPIRGKLHGSFVCDDRDYVMPTTSPATIVPIKPTVVPTNKDVVPTKLQMDQAKPKETPQMSTGPQLSIEPPAPIPSNMDHISTVQPHNGGQHLMTVD